MHCIELKITAQAPLAIGRQKSGSSVSEAENHIPGSVIRGAIATQILRVANLQTGDRSQNGDPLPYSQSVDLSQNGGDFQTLFLDPEAAIFRNAYPAIARVNAQEAKAVNDPIRVLPVTAVSSKDNPGFKVEGEADEKQKGGVFDTLIDRYCADLCNYPYDPSCPKDQGRVEPFGGFYSCTEEKGITHRYRNHSTSTRFLTRVAINRRRATAQDEMLYSVEVLNESFLRNPKERYPKWNYYEYRSHIWMSDETIAESLTDFINRHQDTFRMGGGVSRGLGRVHIEAKVNLAKSDLKERIQTFNQALTKRWSLWSLMQSDRQNHPGNRTFFTLNLQSDAILTDRWQRTMVVSTETIRRDLGILDNDLQFHDLQLHASYSSYGYRSGWNAAWGLMKEMELITNRGAVFLFSIAQPQQWEDDSWLEKLATLEIWGIGDRTSEGFGQVRICDEFHRIFRENAV